MDALRKDHQISVAYISRLLVIILEDQMILYHQQINYLNYLYKKLQMAKHIPDHNNIKISTLIHKNHIIKPISIPCQPSSPTRTTKTPIHINPFNPTKIKRLNSFGQLNPINRYNVPFNKLIQQSTVSQTNTTKSLSQYPIKLLRQQTYNLQNNINLQYFKSTKNSINLINLPIHFPKHHSTHQSPTHPSKNATQMHTIKKVSLNEIPSVGGIKIIDKIFEETKNKTNNYETIDNNIEQIKQTIANQDKKLLTMEDQFKQKPEGKLPNHLQIHNMSQSIKQLLKNNQTKQSSTHNQTQLSLKQPTDPTPNQSTYLQYYTFKQTQHHSLQSKNKQSLIIQSKYQNQYQSQKYHNLKGNDKMVQRVPGKIQKITCDATHQDIQYYIRQKYLKHIHPHKTPPEQLSIPSQNKSYIQNHYNQQSKSTKLQPQNKQNSQQAYQKDVETRNTFTFMPKERQNDLDVLQLERKLDKKFKNVQPSKNHKQAPKPTKKSNTKDDESDDTLNVAQLQQNLMKFQQTRVKSTIKDNQQMLANQKKYLSTLDHNKKQTIDTQRDKYLDYNWKKNTKIFTQNKKEFRQKYNLESYKKFSSQIDLKYNKYILGKKNIKEKSKQYKNSSIYQIQQEEYQKQAKDNKYVSQYQNQVKGIRNSKVQKNISYDDLRYLLWK